MSFRCGFIHLQEDKRFWFLFAIQNYACPLAPLGVYTPSSTRTCCVFNLAFNIHSISWGYYCAGLVGCAASCCQDLRVHHRYRQRNYHRYLIESALVTTEIWSHDRPPAGPTAHLLTVPGMMGADLPLSGSRTSRFINGGGE